MLVYVAYAIAGVIGAGVGLSEILSRYRDAPWAAAGSRAGVAYIAFNAVVSLGVLFLIRDVVPVAGIFDATNKDMLPQLVLQGITAGVGAMAILRSSVLTARVGSKDVEIGPAAVVDIFRTTMDRDVARVRATPRAQEVMRIMKDVSFVRSYEPLSCLGIALLQSVGAEERARIEQELGALANRPGRTDEDKALELGLILAGSVGFPALQATKDMLGSKITNSKERPVIVLDQVKRLDTDAILRDLPPVCLALNPSVPVDDQKALSEQIDGIVKSALSDHAKRVNAGLVLVNAVGEENFKAAVDLLAPPPPREQPLGVSRILAAEEEIPATAAPPAEDDKAA